jgi:dynein assembly factor 1, axonemal
MEMTKQFLKAQCKKDSLYSTPHINDKLYLHYKGFRRVENLEEYTGLKVLWLEGNGLTCIEGLNEQRELLTLYLHENLIETISGLENNVSFPLLVNSSRAAHTTSLMSSLQLRLDTLNLCKNSIRRIENLSHLHQLQVCMHGSGPVFDAFE